MNLFNTIDNYNSMRKSRIGNHQLSKKSLHSGDMSQTYDIKGSDLAANNKNTSSLGFGRSKMTSTLPPSVMRNSPSRSPAGVKMKKLQEKQGMVNSSLSYLQQVFTQRK